MTHHRPLLLAMVAVCTLFLGGCALGDWMRDPVSSDDLVAAQNAHASALVALEEAREIATRLDAEKAAKLIASAEHAVQISAEAVKRVEDDGSPRWLAIFGTVATIVAGVAGGRAASVAGTLKRVVDGVQSARRALPDEHRKKVDKLLGTKQLPADAARIQAIKVKAHMESATA